MLIQDAVQQKRNSERHIATIYDKSYEKGLLPDKTEMYWEEGLKRYCEEMVMWASGYSVNRGANNSPIEVKVFFVQSMKQYAEKILPLRNDKPDIPIIAVQITGIAPDYTRYVPHAHNAVGYLFDLGLTEDGKYRRAKDADYPVLMSFKLSAWGKQYQDMFQINYYLMKQFHHGGTSYIIVDGAISRLEFKGMNDASQLEAGATGDRLLRWDYSIDCKAWMKEPEHLVPTVFEIPIVVVDENNSYLAKNNNDLVGKTVKNQGTEQ